MPYVDINGFRMWYREAGSGQPVVFVHGGFVALLRSLQPADTYEWTWEHDLASDFRFVSYDRRGCRRSSIPTAGYDLATQAKDLAELLDHLSIPKASIIGSSAGGPIAMVFASTHSDRVRALALVETSFDLWRETPGDDDIAIVRSLMQVLEEKGPEAAFWARPEVTRVWFEGLWRRREAMAEGKLDEYLSEEQRLFERLNEEPVPIRVRGHTAELLNVAAYLDLDLRPSLARITSPCLVLHGDGDLIVPLDWGREIHDAIPHSRFEVVEGGGHGLLFDSEEARSMVKSFVADAEAQ